MSTLAETLRQLASQFERLIGNGGGENSVLGTMFSGGLGFNGASNRSVLPSAVGQLASGVLGGPIGMVASAFTSLFRDEPEPVVFPAYEPPEALSLDFDIGATEASLGSLTTSALAASSVQTVDARNQQANSAATVLIQVNAMDASSFSDRRNEIARAVREALTRNHSLRDEIWED